jgi:Ca2+-binding RTX toxin-like protein
LRLSASSDETISVDYETADGTAFASLDYTSVSGTATFGPGQTEVIVHVPTAPNGTYDGVKQFYLNLSQPIGVIVPVGHANVEASINDDEFPVVLPDPDIEARRFYSYGIDLYFTYVVNETVSDPFRIAIYASYDGISHDHLLEVVEGDPTNGVHTATIHPTFDDLQEDYYIIAYLDSDEEIEEENEGNNSALFYGDFAVHEASSGKTVRHIHGTDSPDSIFPWPTGWGIDEVHVRSHGGDDEVTARDHDVPIWVFGGSENDLIIGALGNDFLDGGAGDDDIYSGDGADDILIGGAGHDDLFGHKTLGTEGGNDLFFGGDGDDSLVGGGGNDLLQGGEGADTISGYAGNDVIYGDAGNDFVFAGEGNDVVFGGDGDDVLHGEDGNDVIYGNAGIDQLFGELGADILYGGLGNDTVFGGADDDLIFGNQDDDTLSGETGDDEIYGGSGNDTIDGGDGDDLLVGGSGNDEMEGGLGNDQGFGGAGDDTFDGSPDEDTVEPETFEPDGNPDDGPCGHPGVDSGTIIQDPSNPDQNVPNGTTYDVEGCAAWGEVGADDEQGGQGDSRPDVTKIEFVLTSNIDWSGVSNADKAAYGKLDLDTNPNGSESDQSKPAFGGGDRIFPDADVNTHKQGRNVVRVRATVTNMSEGQKVYFRSFDVDDPSSNKLIDSNDDNDIWNDNRGQLANSVHFPAPSDIEGRGFRGRLRPVAAGNTFGSWGGDGEIVEATVKPLKDATGNVVAGVFVAEVDLAVSFAPGDNFRVAANPSRDVLARLERPNIPISSYPSPEAQKKLTPQLSVWRYLHIEDDTPAGSPTRNLMAEATTNRGQNRFADAYMEPNYSAINGPGKLNTTPLAQRQATLVGGTLSLPDQNAIDAARNTKNHESDVFWVVYVGSGWTLPTAPALMGIAASTDAAKPWEWAVLFDANINAGAPSAPATAFAKTTIHEIGHQILRFRINGLDFNGHRGRLADVIAYYNATDAQKQDATRQWEQKVNIMTAAAIQVPMNNPTASFPVGFTDSNRTRPIPPAAIQGNNAGTIDQFYFYAADLKWMRSRTKSPGR